MSSSAAVVLCRGLRPSFLLPEKPLPVRGEAGLHGLTANAVASLSLDPPLSRLSIPWISAQRSDMMIFCVGL